MDYLFLIIVIIVCYLIYSYLTKELYFFKESGIPYLPAWPILGNMTDVIFQRKHFTQILQEIYNLNSEAKYVGFFDFIEPVFLLRDLELIKDVTIKKFEYFPDHKPLCHRNLDPLMGENLFNLIGEEWKQLRNILSPSFTSSKMKMMFDLMNDCAENVITFIESQPDEFKKMICTQDLFTKYTNDIVATCGFGFIVDSFSNPNNEFYTIGKKSTNMESILGLKFLISRTFPNLMKIFNIRLFDNKTYNFYNNLIRDNLYMREEKNLSRPDMLQLMMEAWKNNKLNIKQITAQSFGFFFAGFESTTSTICMLTHELVLNPEVQSKLQAEIDDVLMEYNGKITYEAIDKMCYLDAVLNEINRLHSQGFILDRVCKIPYELPATLPGIKPLKLTYGMRVLIPVHAINRDPKYYVDPDKFNPDRYYGKKVKLNDVFNLGFGIGPRSCIGTRFVNLQIKILLAQLLRKFNFKSNEKTCIPIRYSKKTPTIQAEGGFWLTMEPRI